MSPLSTFQVLLNEGKSTEEGEATVQQLMGQLGISKADLISCAYLDLFTGKSSTCVTKVRNEHHFSKIYLLIFCFRPMHVYHVAFV